MKNSDGQGNSTYTRIQDGHTNSQIRNGNRLIELQDGREISR